MFYSNSALPIAKNNLPAMPGTKSLLGKASNFVNQVDKTDFSLKVAEFNILKKDINFF